MLSQRLTVRPCASVATKVSSRVFLMWRAIFVDGLVPGDVFPMIRARPPHLRLQQAPVVQDVLIQRRSLGAQRAAIDGMIRIAFDVHHLRRDVLRLVAEGVNDDAATHRTIRAGRARLGGAGDFEFPGLRVGRLDIEAENRRDDSACSGL